MNDRMRLTLLAIWAPLYALAIANGWQAWVRFSSPRLNQSFMLLVFASPLLGLWIVRKLTGRTIRVAVAAILTPVGLVSGALLVGTALPGMFGLPAFERLRTVQVHDKMFGVLRSKGGAGDDPGIVVRKEQGILPGLLRVTEVCACHPADDVRLTSVDRSTIRCEFPPYGSARPQVEVVHWGE